MDCLRTDEVRCRRMMDCVTTLLRLRPPQFPSSLLLCVLVLAHQWAVDGERQLKGKKGKGERGKKVLTPSLARSASGG